jgi:tetratricopeptide (TPR) repeat protein
MANHHFISFSESDAGEFAFKLRDALEAGPPHLRCWLDRRDIRPGRDLYAEIEEAIRGCASLLFVMSRDSIEDQSDCKLEWTRALRYKKPVIPLLHHHDAVLPLRLGSRLYIDFTGNFDQALARLRNHLTWLESPAGVLQALEDRLADAKHELRRAGRAEQETRIKSDIVDLETVIESKRRSVADPEGAKKRTEEIIASGLERERQPSQPIAGVTRTKFLNPPPADAPTYFQNRYLETKLIGDFLKDAARRLMTVVGRGGVGKTATVCRVLKALERRSLPDDLGPLEVDGIVYLSAIGSRRVNAPNLYEDLVRLLPEEAAHRVEAVVRARKTTTQTKTQALLEAFADWRTVVLLDNFEDVIDPVTHNIADAELDEILRALLSLPHHAVKVILTTRIAPRALNLLQPGRQFRLDLDSGLESPHAENILREMDADGKLGLKSATDVRLALARERTRGFPRALEALFAILSADRDTTLEETLAFLPENVTEALVGDAFSRLDVTQTRIMQALALYGRPMPPAAVDYLLQPYQPDVDSAPVLGRLVNMYFARKEAGRYYLHPVDREYALSLLESGDASDRSSEGPPFTLHELRHRAAEYFEEVRQPRENWKTIDDLAPQLAELDLRCEGQDYETAASILRDIGLGYLIRWGWSRSVVELNERVLGKLDDSGLKSHLLSVQGHAYFELGQANRAISYHEQALAIDRNADNRSNEGADLGNLGLCYRALGQTARAIDYHEQALSIRRETGDERGEGYDLNNLGICYSALGRTARAIEFIEQALKIARNAGDRLDEGIRLGNLGNGYRDIGQTARAIDNNEQSLAIMRELSDRRGEGIVLGSLGTCYHARGDIARAIIFHGQELNIAHEVADRVGEGYALWHLAGVFVDEQRQTGAIPQATDAVRIGGETGDPVVISSANATLALAHLCLDDLPPARAAAQAARAVDVPLNNHNVLALLGLIALRQGDRPAAAEAFRSAIAHADVVLERCGQNYSALDARGLALAGMSLLEGADRVPEAIAAFRAARAITSAPGIVARVKQLLDALAPAASAGILSEIYKAAEAQAVD